MEIFEDQLESERLVTRKLTKNDAIIWSEFFLDREAFMYLPSDKPLSNAERSSRWIAKQIKRYKDNGFGLQALINKHTNDFIGQCGLLIQEVDGKIELEVGYHILKEYWGQGYATEAANLFINYAFQNNLAETIISIIDIRNIRSKRVAEKNGLKRVKQTTFKNIDVEIYRISETDWLKEGKGVKKNKF